MCKKEANLIPRIQKTPSLCHRLLFEAVQQHLKAFKRFLGASKMQRRRDMLSSVLINAPALTIWDRRKDRRGL